MWAKHVGVGIPVLLSRGFNAASDIFFVGKKRRRRRKQIGRPKIGKISACVWGKDDVSHWSRLKIKVPKSREKFLQLNMAGGFVCTVLFYISTGMSTIQVLGEFEKYLLLVLLVLLLKHSLTTGLLVQNLCPRFLFSRSGQSTLQECVSLVQCQTILFGDNRVSSWQQEISFSYWGNIYHIYPHILLL